ncbi:MAG: hypothetical protein ACR2NB_15235 [Solirubrobacteraceae bacterium]
MTPVVAALPADPDDRRAFLDGYFPRRLAEATARDDGRWDLSVRPFDEAEMHVDPRLDDGLRWWDPALALPDVPAAVRGTGASQLSLEDAWTGVAFSHWLAERPAEQMTILHVDDHTDLMGPLLTRRVAGGWTDLLTAAHVDLQRPATVAAAVASGAIGVASFFTPFIFEVAQGEIRHLRASPGGAEGTDLMRLVPRDRPDELLAPGAVRPAVELATAGDAPFDGWSYRVTSDPCAWLAELAAGPLLLHVDFDYFCNRFNGDSDWHEHTHANDVGEDEVERRVDRLVAALEAAGVAGAVESVCGALSPGFFPAEYWAATVQRLRGGLASLGVDVSAWR